MRFSSGWSEQQIALLQAVGLDPALIMSAVITCRWDEPITLQVEQYADAPKARTGRP
jgi:hypothetical protein